MNQPQLDESKTTSRSKSVSAYTMQHGISLPLAAGAEPSNDLATLGDLTFRRSTRFKSKVLPYWDFERITCLSTSDGNKTVIARDVPGEGTIIVQELQSTGTVQPSVKVEPSQTGPVNLAKNKPTKRKKASQDENSESTHLAGLPSKMGSLTSTVSNSTPNKTKLSVPPKKRKLFSLGSDFLEGPTNVVNVEGHISGQESTSPSTPLPKWDKNKPVRRSRRANEDKENAISTHLKISNPNKRSRTLQNIKKISTNSENGGTCEMGDVDNPNEADKVNAADTAGGPDEEKCSMDCPDQGKRKKDSGVIIDGNCADGGSQNLPAAATPLGRLPSLDDLGYSTGNDSFSSTMAGSDLQFATVVGSNDNNADSTGQYRIARGVVHNGISVFFIHLTKGYLAFRAPLRTEFIGMIGEGYLQLVNDNKPSVRTQLRPDTEVSVDKDAVVAVGCQEGCSSLTVVMVTMDD